MDISGIKDFFDAGKLVSSLFVAVIIGLLSLYAKIRTSLFMQDIIASKKYNREKKIYLQALGAEYVCESTKKELRYALEKLELEKILNLEDRLPVLQYLHGFENTKYAVRLYKACGNVIDFDTEEKKFVSKVLIDEKFKKSANKNVWIGTILYFLIVSLDYLGLIFTLNQISQIHLTKEYLIGLGFLIFIIFLIIVFFAMKLFEFFLKKRKIIHLLEKKIRRKDL